MRSKVHISSHPVHPMLIPFPLAFLSGACVADVIAKSTSSSDWARIGSILSKAGIVGGLVAGAAGFADYLYTVPPASSAKKRATKHMLANVGALKLFTAATMARRKPSKPLPLWALLAETAGFALLGIGGWLGGTLVYRNQIGVDHRYARAGKWKEASITAEPGEAVVVAREGELEPNQMKLMRVNGKRIVLARTETGYTAFDDRCTHKGGSLAGGVMAENTVTCPWHGSQFDVATGAVKSGPAEQPIHVYPVEVVNGEVRLATTGREQVRAGGSIPPI
ncbi:MAG TPA: DUF2231 domain-containing protein [Bryobacteraceae bacterium]|nr:DUF2231 domain-containing protein [Bryobacteraceae bacterium]